MKTYDERKKSVSQYMDHIRFKRRKIVVAVTSICLAVAVLSAVLFVPYSATPPDVSMYSGSEYYTLIQQLNEATYEKPRYKNNFQALSGFLNDLGSLKNISNAPAGDMRAPMPEDGAPTYSGELSDRPDNGNYEETTDNQVEGVIETDLMKRSDQCIYYLRGTELSVYSIEGEDSKLLGSFTLQKKTEDEEIDFYFYGAEMFLSRDCTTVTVLMNGYGKGNVGAYTVLVNLDVSDPANITMKNEVYFSGSFLSARMVDDMILLVYNYRVMNNQIDFSDPFTYVPQYGIPESMTCIPAESIVCPGEVTSTHYTVISKVNGDTLEVEGSTALLSYSQGLYVSQDTIYATHSYNQKNSEVFNNEYKQTAMTEITGISYASESLEILGTIALEGRVKDQYSMDQYDGILRVVTSTAVSGFKETFFGEYASVTTSVTERNVNLYCVDLADWTVKASVIGFAPAGEEATAVRFDGINAYVCTAEVITLTDPVYFFDLSDLENITYTDTGIISGFSTSLIQLGDGYLLGIGRGDNRQLKIEIYEETKEGVVSVCVYERDASFCEDYKSYFIDRDNDLIGLAVSDHGEEAYILLHFDGYKLHEIVTVACSGALDRVRADIIDGYLYILSGIFTVERIQ